MSEVQHDENRPIRPGDIIPTFATEAEEANWWDAHELSEEFLVAMALPPDYSWPEVRSASSRGEREAGK